MIDQDPIQWESLDEQQLVEHAKRDPTAMSILYRRYYPIIHRYVAKRVATSHDVHDIVADVFSPWFASYRDIVGPAHHFKPGCFESQLHRLAAG